MAWLSCDKRKLKLDKTLSLSLLQIKDILLKLANILPLKGLQKRKFHIINKSMPKKVKENSCKIVVLLDFDVAIKCD